MKTIMALVLLLFFAMNSNVFGSEAQVDPMEEEILRTLEQLAQAESKKREEKLTKSQENSEVYEAEFPTHTSSL